MNKYTYSGTIAHTITDRADCRSLVEVPDEVADDQQAYDGMTFPVRRNGRRTGRAMLRGDLYGLNTSGTGDMVVCMV
jgi:hypothetical protein